MSEEPFGRYLLEQGAVSRRALEEATQAKVFLGGRLGTHLVESGALGLDELERHLASHLQVPLPRPAELECAASEALGAIPRELVQRLEVIPFRLEAGMLHVGMADPWNPDAVNELAATTGLRIRPYLVAEVRLFGLLEKHFGIRRDPRAIELPPEPHAREGVRRGAASHPERSGGDPDPPGPGGTPDLRPLRPGEELLDAETFSSLHAGIGRPEAPPEIAEIELVNELEDAPAPEATAAGTLEESLARAEDVDEVARVALRFALEHAPLTALFLIHPEKTVRCLGARVRAAELRGRPFSAFDDLLGRALQTGEIHRVLLVREAGGRPSDGGAREVAGEAAVFPVRIGERLVNLLYVEGPASLEAASESGLATLCDRVAAAYERIIRARRERFC